MSVGLLMKVFPADVVDAVIAECGRTVAIPWNRGDVILSDAHALLASRSWPVLSPGAGVRAGRRPPGGLGLDARSTTRVRPARIPCTDPAADASMHPQPAS